MNDRKQSISSGILFGLSLASFILTGYFCFLLFRYRIFPLKYRLIGIGVFAVISLLLLALSRLRGGVTQKIIGIFLCSAVLFLLDVGILYAHSGIQTLQSIQHSAKKNTNQKHPQDLPHQAIDVPVNEKSFVAYISGIDTYGKIESESRSDVNIVAAINPKTHRILMVSVPRDSYLPIMGGGEGEMDKLTHAGIYGISSSIQTLEHALDLKINYYVRLNFSSFLNIIDVIDGVDVDNPREFTAFDDTYFPEGHLHLNSQEALSFVRERKSLEEGDFARQKNQERVIEAVFKRLLSSEFVLKFQAIMETVSESTETNMPAETIMDFVNSQMDQGGQWKFDTAFIEGSSQMGLPSYAMPGYDLWFFVPEEDSLQEVHNKLDAVLRGVEYQEPSSVDSSDAVEGAPNLPTDNSFHTDDTDAVDD